MRKSFTEESALFMSVLKWSFLATIIGAVVGFATSIFLEVLDFSVESARSNSYYFVLMPLAFYFSALLVKVLAPDASGHGTEKVIEAVHKRSGHIKLAVVPVKLVATVITIAFGGSAGKEGPCAQIGAGLASGFARLFRFNEGDRKKLVICGISAGFASVFGTPMAGAIFGVEVLFIGAIMYEVLLPSFIAGVVSYQVALYFGVVYDYHPLSYAPVFSQAFFLKVVLAGIFFGLCSRFLIFALDIGRKLSAKIPYSMPIKGLIGGSLLVILTFIFSERFLGLGLETIETSLTGGEVPWYSFIAKSVFTSVTLATGGSGGIVTPIFFVGSTSGSWFADILSLDRATFASIGMVSLLAGAANTPIAAGIMAVEVFGYEVAPFAVVAAVVSFLMSGHKTVFPTQILSIKKSESIEVKIGTDMKNVNAEFKAPTGGLAQSALKFADKLNYKKKNGNKSRE